MRNKAWRNHKRHAKAMRRIKEDRAQHGNDHSCLCFSKDGRTFSFFADNPKLCSRWCCGNMRDAYGPTIQEIKAPNIDDWNE